jgi:hypothetical protein
MNYEQVKTLKPTEFKPEVLNVEKSQTKNAIIDRI